MSHPRQIGRSADEQWHAGLLAAHGGLDRIRAAEKSAKDKRLGLWENTAPTTSGKSAAQAGSAGAAIDSAPATNKGQSFDATVVRIWGSDQLSLVAKGEEVERRVQLASVRGPRGAGAREAYWANEAKEWVICLV
jgi:staphylococcal nuclease domain-containing protein 1